MTGTRSAVRAAAGVLVALSFVAVGCGGSDNKNTSAGAGTQPASIARSDLQARLDAYYKGTFGDFPSSAPRPQPGKNLWVISLNEASPGVHIATENIVAASKVLKWRTRVVDTKGAPDAATVGIKQAIGAKADVIVLNVIECGAVEAAVKQAKAAGVKVVETTAADCNAPNVGHKALFEATEGFAPGGFYNWIHQRAQVHANWTLAQLGGKPGKVLLLHQTDYSGLVVGDKQYAQDVHKGCAQCDVVDVPFVYADLTNGQLKGKVQAALVRNPDAQVMIFPYDATLALGGAAAIQGSGRAGNLKVMGGECADSTLQLIREGTVTACLGNPYSWLGWQTVDDANRLLNGQPPAQPSVGQQLVDKNHNLPPAGRDYNGPGTDYAAAYKKIWATAD